MVSFKDSEESNPSFELLNTSASDCKDSKGEYSTSVDYFKIKLHPAIFYHYGGSMTMQMMPRRSHGMISALFFFQTVWSTE